MLCIHTFFLKIISCLIHSTFNIGIDGDFFSNNRFKSESQSSVTSSNLADQRDKWERPFLLANVFCVKGSNISEKNNPVGTDFLK